MQKLQLQEHGKKHFPQITNAVVSVTMLTYKKTVCVEYNINEVYSIIADIQQYPEFVPWCSAVEIIPQVDTTENIAAILSINFGTIQQKYHSYVTFTPPFNNVAKVKAVGIDSGSIKHLNTLWELEEIEHNKTNVSFNIEIQLHSKIFSTMLHLLFPNLCNKMIEVFLERLRKQTRNQQLEEKVK